MKLTWIGQAGFRLEWDGLTVLLDPYLSDSCGKLSPDKYRRFPVEERYLRRQPDVIVTTHDHPDHYDRDTLDHFMQPGGDLTLLGSAACWKRAKTEYSGMCNPVRFTPRTRWTQNGILFEAVPAEHSEPTAVGVVIRDGSRVFYFSGDTLCNDAVLEALPQDIDYAFLPVNGVGNNMNPADAAWFADHCSAKQVIPVHVGMLDDLTPQSFTHPKALYLKPYEAVTL